MVHGIEKYLQTLFETSQRWCWYNCINPILFSETDRLGGDFALAEALTNNGVIIAQVGTTSTDKNAVPRGVARVGDVSGYYNGLVCLGPSSC